MTAAIIPTEDECWAALDRYTAAIAGDDVDEQLAAIGNALDTWLAAGHISVDDIRAGLLPGLRDVMARMIELDPELADAQATMAVDRMDARNGISEAGWAALVLDAYQNARQDLGLDLLLTPELRDSLVRLSRGIETRTDLACLLLHRHAHQRFTPAQADHAEAWSTSKGARREAQSILELLGEPIERREGWYLQRQLPRGAAE
jgi:hypothetical protein